MEKFSVVLEYPQSMEVGSVAIFQGKHIVISKITKVEPVTENLFLVSGSGKISER